MKLFSLFFFNCQKILKANIAFLLRHLQSQCQPLTRHIFMYTKQIQTVLSPSLTMPWSLLLSRYNITSSASKVLPSADKLSARIDNPLISQLLCGQNFLSAPIVVLVALSTLLCGRYRTIVKNKHNKILKLRCAAVPLTSGLPNNQYEGSHLYN